MPHRSPVVAFALLALGVLACGLTGAPTSPVPTAESRASATPEAEPLPPVDFTDVLDAEVAAGEIRYEDGLVRLLGAFLGDPEVSLPAAYDEVITTEGNSAVDRAWEYIASGTDEAAKSEMRRLLDLIVPTTAQLEGYSQPAEAGRGAPGLARPPAQIDCARLWLDGFPLEGVTTYRCFSHVRATVPGVATFTVYFPEAWRGDPSLLPWFERAREAAYNSLSTLGRYGPFDDVSLIFSMVPYARAAYLATTHPYDQARRETCPILIYPVALSLEPNQFEQVVAHEIFHCYQFNNLEPQMQIPTSVKMWWSEGSAEYFSNVVYPDVDYEYRFANAFDAQSATTPLYQMGYENFGFFQFLANRWGDNAVITFLESMPTTGGASDQQDRLAAWPGMQEVFHDFGKAYLDLNIPDTSGGTLPLTPTYDHIVEVPQGALHQEYSPAPFVLDRHELFFVDDTRFSVRRELVDGDGRDSANQGGRPGAWGPLPPTVNTACGEGEYLLLVTSAVPSGSPAGVVSIDTDGQPLEEGVDCEACLLGTWELDNSSYLFHMGGAWPLVTGALPSGGGDIVPTGVFGAMSLTFNEDGTAEGVQSDWGIAGKATGPDGAIEVAVMYNGTGQATWRVEVDEDTEERYLFFENGEFGIISQLVFEGHSLDARPTGGSNDTVFLSSPQPYTCTDTTLTYNPDDPLGPIWFVRTSEVIEAP